MNPPPNKLLTPILLKTSDDMPWPEEESVFQLVTADGLFLCRNHKFFTSSVPTDHWSPELGAHAPFLRLRYPRLSQRMFERVVGFFAVIAESFGAEAAALLAWNERDQRVEVVVPRQRSLISSAWNGRSYPLSVEYDVPALPEGWMWIGDVHSHGPEDAYASAQDARDELHRPGIHLVVGRLCDAGEPPAWCLEAQVDRTRFRIKQLETVVEGYERRRIAEVPTEWLAQVEVRRWTSQQGSVRIHPADEPKEAGETPALP